MKKLIKQILKFGIVGVIATIIDWSVFYISTNYLHIHYMISNVIGFIVSVIFNYIASIKWVFDIDKEKNQEKNFVLFIVLSIVGLILNEIILYIAVDTFKLNSMLGKIISTCIVMVFNFITRKKFLETKKSNKKKLIFFAYDLNIGGIENALINLLDRLDYNKYDIDLILEKNEGSLKKNLNKNVNVKEYKLSYNKFIPLRKLINLTKRILWIIKYHSKYDFSCCYATYLKSGVKLALMASKNNCIYVHADYKYVYNKEDFYKFFNERNINKFKHIVFVSNESKDNFKKYYPNLKDKLIVANNFIDEDIIIKKSKDKVNIKKFKGTTFVYIGRLDEKQKRVSRLLRLIKNLKDDNELIRLIIVGNGPDIKDYKKYTKDNNLNDYVNFVGAKTNPYPYMKLASYIILTSDYEGFPVIYQEAIALNKKIITTIDVTDDIIDIKNNFGYIVSKEDNKLKEEIKNIIHNDNLKYSKLNIKDINKKKLNYIERIINGE